MDFIVELPPSHGFNAIAVFVDKLSKMAHFAPTTTSVSAEGTARLFFDKVCVCVVTPRTHVRNG